ncbi:MAG: type VI secretion system baseplate subunit TssG [Rhizobiaceae bacterium]
MADDARQSPPDLKRSRSGANASFDFFELLRQLESGGRRFGQKTGPDHEPARLGQQIRLGFATQDVAEYHEPADGGPPRVTIANIGLLGPEGPMPLHLTRWVLDRLSQRWFAGADARQTSDTTFVDFVNLLQHRMMALFYRAWADHTPAVQVERPGSGRIHAMLEAMAGIGLPATRNAEDGSIDLVKLRQAAALANQVDGPERLTLFVAEAFRVPVALKEFVAAWVPIPQDLQSRIGQAFATLGGGATVGRRVFSRQSRVELVIGPVGIQDYLSFLPDGERFNALKRVIRDLVGEQMDVDVRVVLAGAEVPKPSLGQVRLGRTTWLARPDEKGDADDMRLRAVVGWRPENAGAGA